MEDEIVWVVVYSGSHLSSDVYVERVFSSKEKAEAYISERIDPHGYSIDKNLVE